MPSKKKGGKNRSFGDWLEYLLKQRPDLVVFVLILLLAFSALGPFLTRDLSVFWRSLFGDIRETLMNVISMTSVLLGFYAIHQATSFRDESAEEKAEDDRRRAREQKQLEERVSELKSLLRTVLTAVESKNGLGSPRATIGASGKDTESTPSAGGNSLSGKDTTT